MEHILSLSYGKDTLACLGAIEKLGWPEDDGLISPDDKVFRWPMLEEELNYVNYNIAVNQMNQRLIEMLNQSCTNNLKGRF